MTKMHKHLIITHRSNSSLKNIASGKLSMVEVSWVLSQVHTVKNSCLLSGGRYRIDILLALELFTWDKYIDGGKKMWTFPSWAWGRDCPWCCQWLRILFILKLNLHPHFSLPVGVLGYVALTICFVTASASTWYGFSSGCRYLFPLFRIWLRYDLCSIKCTRSKYRIWWVLTSECICVTTTTIKTEYSSTQKSSLTPLCSQLCLLPAIALVNHGSVFCHYRFVLLVLEFHINGMIQYAYLFLFSKMFLKFIHVIACINSETAYFFLSFFCLFLFIA